jgi:antitoxin component YwqK of YwqJK toxin-antitoxin module
MWLRIFLVISLIFSLSYSSAQEGVDISSLYKKKNDTYIDQQTGKPYTGAAFDKYPNGQKGMQGKIVNGKFDGLWTWWYEDGSKKRETTYKNGQKTGYSYWWYKNGVKKSEIRFAFNKNVEQKRWDEKGKRLPNPKLGRP